jgi:hypothetical protein
LDPATLATAAVAALGPYLVAGGTEAAKTAGKDLYGWLKGKLTPGGNEALAEVERAPQDADAQGALRLQLRKQLEAEPALLAELARLLDALPRVGPVQKADVAGDGHVVQQVVGSGNIVGG